MLELALWVMLCGQFTCGLNDLQFQNSPKHWKFQYPGKRTICNALEQSILTHPKRLLIIT